MQKYSYHTHTNFSDGHNTITEMLRQATELGWQEIGISDHLIVHKDFKQSPSWNKMQHYYGSQIYRTEFKEAVSVFLKHKEEIKKAAKFFPLKVFVGAEVDFFTYDGWLDEFKDFQRQVNLDYYISGNHYMFGSEKDFPIEPEDLSVFIESKEDQQKYIINHFKTLEKASESGLFDFMAHIDYVRRSPLVGEQNFASEKKHMLETFAKNNTAVELSTKGLRKDGDFYPVHSLLEEMKAQNISVVISDDAHRTSELGQDFSKAELCLQNMNYNNRWKLE